ncbi:hypothetical protein ACTPOK_41300 [Streptomyces inhibens]|uniref:hypothetical protein n=1 Tax=Streptomyces inhibens TaxID=2293571 RepID=UPI00402AF0A5
MLEAVPVFAPAAIHALPGHEISALRTDGLDLAHGIVESRLGLRRHTLYLEELTHPPVRRRLAHLPPRPLAPLANPHLLISRRTALDPDHAAVCAGTLCLVLPQGLVLSKLRQDRILKEAFAMADPVRLMRLFGISEQTRRGIQHTRAGVSGPPGTPRPGRLRRGRRRAPALAAPRGCTS